MTEIQNIARLSKYYVVIHSLWNPIKLKSNWKEALNFLFGHIFYGGRRDSLSNHYNKFAFEIIIQYDEITANTIKEITCKLKKKTKKNYKFPERDTKMVKEILNLLRNINGYNIIGHAVEEMTTCKLENYARFHRKLTDVHNIGNKKATLFMRDIADVFQISEEIEKRNNNAKKALYKYLQPIDTWVFKVAEELGILDSNDSPNWCRDSRKIVEVCVDIDVSPIEFNQGAWMIGRYFGEAVDNMNIVVKQLDKVEEILKLYGELKH